MSVLTCAAAARELWYRNSADSLRRCCWLRSQAGGRLVEVDLESGSSLYFLLKPSNEARLDCDLLVNCTGLEGARKGFNDNTVYPIRGQVSLPACPLHTAPTSPPPPPPPTDHQHFGFATAHTSYVLFQAGDLRTERVLASATDCLLANASF